MFAHLPPALAASRLRSNILGLVLITAVRALFVPYLLVRRALVNLIDAVGPDFAVPTRGARVVWWLETIFTLVFIVNAVHAAYYVAYPHPLQPPAGPKLVPTPMSSPLTRGYLTSSSATPSSSASSASRALSTPSKPGGSTGKRALGKDYRSSPLAVSTSTARAFNLASHTPPSATGLFYDDSARASPSKVGRQVATAESNAAPAPQPSPASSAAGGEFVVIGREEKEWAENVWKGVRGRRRK
ncbi:hypothetical protein Q5752_000292 [Cryptotrichosporon argae]